MAERASRRHDGSSSIIMLTTGAVCLAVLALLVTAVLSAQPSTGIITDTQPGLTAEPTTTMEAVRPVAEQIAPVLSGRDDAASGSPVSAAWTATTSEKTGIGTTAVDAYGRASLRLATEQPRCRLGWTTLAGIGGIESGHGTSSGAYLLPDGTTSHPIIGPALDGTAGAAAIRSDAISARWHGDSQWDHAVGPMQFIPSTWNTWGADGNGDGDTDPNNIIDSAYTAGLYLCASGADLSTGAGWTRAIFSYNHSDDYVRSVLARANRCAGVA